MNDSILDLRARRLAERIERPVDRAKQATVVVVRAGAERVGIPVAGVREIVRPPPLTPLPRLPPGMVGLAQLRGELLTVIDLVSWLGLPPSGTATHLAVVDGPKGPLGLLVGEVLGFRELYRDELGAAGLDASAPVTGRTADLLLALDLAALLAAPTLRVGSRPEPAERTEAAR